MAEMEEEVSYYSILGVSAESSIEEIKRAYRRLAMQWHPDKWARTPSLLSEAKRKFQQIQEAYSVVSDERKRTLYDIGLYDPQEDEEEEEEQEQEVDEGFSDFMQEMFSLMEQERRENKQYSLEELQSMLTDMVQGLGSSFAYCESPCLDNFDLSKRPRCDSNATIDYRDSQFVLPSWGMYGTSSFCS